MHIFAMLFKFLNDFFTNLKDAVGAFQIKFPLSGGTCRAVNCLGSEGGAVPFLSLFSPLLSKMKMAQADLPGAVQPSKVC